MSKRSALIGLALVGATGAGLFAFSRPAGASAVLPVEQSHAGGVAVAGHDPVAYFPEGRPVAGKASIALSHNGAKWWFASEANREAFRRTPDRYAPQFGGYCAWAVSQGHTAPIDPRAWTIREGKLYLNYDLAVQAEWEKDIAANIAKGERNWPRIRAGSAN
jgi:YHS domain-containing protein